MSFEIRDYCFIETVVKRYWNASSTRNGLISNFLAEKIALKKSMKFVDIYTFYDFSTISKQ